MQAFEYGRMLRMIESGKLQPAKLVRQVVSLERAAETLGQPADLQVPGVTVINRF